jgi:HEAT repeat protein
MTAHMALVRIKAKGWDVHLGALGKFLEHEDPVLRANAAEALGNVGPEAQSQVRRLIEAMKDVDPRVVGATLWALGRLERGAVEAVPHLQQFAGDTDRSPNLRKMATEAIDAIQGKKKK